MAWAHTNKLSMRRFVSEYDEATRKEALKGRKCIEFCAAADYRNEQATIREYLNPIRVQAEHSPWKAPEKSVVFSEDDLMF